MPTEIKQLKENGVEFYPVTVGEAVMVDNDTTVSSKIASLEANSGNPVKYTAQSLTEDQQMQARKNQGLYYSDIKYGEKTLTFPKEGFRSYPWAYTITDEEIASTTAGASIYTFIKVSDDCPTKEELISATMYDDNTRLSLLDPSNIEISFYGQTSFGYLIQEDGYYCGIQWNGEEEYTEGLGDMAFFVVTDDSVNNIELTGMYDPSGEAYAVANNLSKGIWIYFQFTPQGSIEESDWIIDGSWLTELVYNGYIEDVTVIEDKYTQAVTYSNTQTLTKDQQMQARINQDLYATTTIDDTFTFDGDLENVLDYFQINYMWWAVKISDRTDLDLNDISSGSIIYQWDTNQYSQIFTNSDCTVESIDDLWGLVDFDPPIQILTSSENTPIAFIANSVEVTPDQSSPRLINGLYILYNEYDYNEEVT